MTWACKAKQLEVNDAKPEQKEEDEKEEEHAEEEIRDKKSQKVGRKFCKINSILNH